MSVMEDYYDRCEMVDRALRRERAELIEVSTDREISFAARDDILDRIGEINKELGEEVIR